MKNILFILIGLLLASSVAAQNVSKKEIKSLEKKGFRYIPAGRCTIPDDPLYPSRKSTAYTLTGFFMFDAEVSNMLYTEFLHHLKTSGDTAKYAVAAIDSNQWEAEGLVRYYSSRPAYKYYPVVNVSYEGAVLFCEWLTKTINHEGWEVTLPARAQWVYAAAQSNHSDTNFRIWRSEYSGGSPYLTNSKGSPMYNYHRIGDRGIVTTDTDYSSTLSHAIIDEHNSTWRGGQEWDGVSLFLPQITMPVKSYFPNGAGLYNMSGNVAEMVIEKGIAVGGNWNDPGGDITILSYKKYSIPSPMVGFRPILIINNKKE